MYEARVGDRCLERAPSIERGLFRPEAADAAEAQLQKLAGKQNFKQL